ncbi:MAG: DUF2442 domain-containing protein [Bacteroidota bacterium]|nr:DUF2442 domain-containing protein [Bacteroidota bacterium]
MHKIIEAKPLENYKIWIKFSDGVEGIVDLSDLVGKGVFSLWKDPKEFNSFSIDSQSHTLVWKDEIDLCPDTLYAKILNLDPMSILNKQVEHI